MIIVTSKVKHGEQYAAVRKLYCSSQIMLLKLYSSKMANNGVYERLLSFSVVALISSKTGSLTFSIHVPLLLRRDKMHTRCLAEGIEGHFIANDLQPAHQAL